MTENEYTQKAIDSYIESLKRATRFELDNVKILQSKTSITKSTFTADFRFETSPTKNTVPGGVDKKSEDEFFNNNWNSYESKCSEEYKNEFNRLKTYDESIERFVSVPFASLKEEIIHVRTDPKRILHEYTCSTCSGRGKHTCPDCKGRKYFDCTRCDKNGNIICRKCGGKPRSKCGNCEGTGRTRHDTAPDSHGQRHPYYLDCTSCNAKGYKECSCKTGLEECPDCHRTKKIPCKTCGAKGEVDCQTCKKHGYLTEIYEIATYATPSYSAEYASGSPDYLSEVIEKKIGLSSFVDHGEILYISSDISHEDRCVALEYNATLYIAEIEVQIDTYKTTAIIYGRNFALFDAGGILGNLLNEDLQNVEDLLEEKALFSWQYQKLLYKPISLFMESEINQQMVDEMNKAKELEPVFENLGRALSKEYIESAGLSLKIILSRLINKTYLEGGAIYTIFLMAIIFSFSLFGSPMVDKFEFFGLSFMNGTYTVILYGMAVITLITESILANLMITKMGNSRLKIFANKSAGGTKFLNGVILIGLATVLNYGSVQLSGDAAISSFESSQVEAPPVTSSNSDEQPVIETNSEPEIEPVTTNAPKNENLHKDLIDACEKGKGHLCYQLGFSYQLDGDAENAKKYMQKACDAGFQDGCDGL